METGMRPMAFRAFDLDLVHPTQHEDRLTASSLALMEKGQQLVDHQPPVEALNRAGRVLAGETRADDGRGEFEAKYEHHRSQRIGGSRVVE